LDAVKVSLDSVAVLDKVDGDLYVAEGAIIKAEDSEKVTVSGTV